MPKRIGRGAEDDDIVKFLRSFTRRRLTRVVMYGLLTAGAAVSAMAPSQVLSDQSSALFVIVWTACFAAAAGACLIGSVLDRWIAEFVMIPLLSTTLIVFGIALGAQAWADDTWRVLPYAFLMNAYAFGLLARWRDVQALLRIANHMEDSQ